MAIPDRKFFICLMVVILVILQGCAAKETTGSGFRIGLHIDAVLEFVVEYPLQWKKDRRLAYGRNEGEVRWSPAEKGDTLLRVTSHVRGHQTDDLELAMKEYPGLITTMREQLELPAGQAWHVSGQTAQQQVEIYLFLKPGRVYSIILQTPLQDFARYDALLAKIVHSFQLMTE